MESETLRASLPPKRGEKRFAAWALAGTLGWGAALAATTAGAPANLDRLALGLVLLALPIVVWRAYLRSPPQLRRALMVASPAASVSLVGALVWLGVFLADDETAPRSPGGWEGLFACARLLLLAAVVVALRSLASLRLAAPETTATLVAGLTLAAAALAHTIEGGPSVASLVTLTGPLFGIVTVLLLGSAALASPELPRSLALLALGEAVLTIAGFTSALTTHTTVAANWEMLAAVAGAVLLLLAAVAIVLDVDRPLRLPDRGVRALEQHAAIGSTLVFLVAIALTLAVAADELRIGRDALALIGLGATLAVAMAMAVRLHITARARDRLRVANETLQRTNAGLRTFPLSVTEGFKLIDERTDGRLREVITQAGDDLAALVEESLGDEDS